VLAQGCVLGGAPSGRVSELRACCGREVCRSGRVVHAGRQLPAGCLGRDLEYAKE
jgi:hypothetical protein